MEPLPPTWRSYKTQTGECRMKVKFLILFLLLVTACTPSDPSPSSSGQPNVVRITREPRYEYPETNCPVVENQRIISERHQNIEVTVFSREPEDELSVFVDGKEFLYCTQIYSDPVTGVSISFTAPVVKSGSTFELINHTRSLTQTEVINIDDKCCIIINSRADGWQVDLRDEPILYE